MSFLKTINIYPVEANSDFGTCPVCSKGNIVKSSLGYCCNYFKSLHDKCSFNIYKSYFGKEINEHLLLQLLQNGKTDTFDDLQKKDLTFFSGCLALDNGSIKPQFKNLVLNTDCPVCGSPVESLLSGYACQNYLSADANKKCAVFIPKSICGVDISADVAETLLAGNETPILDGFKNSTGNPFSSRLVFTPELKVAFSNNLCPCPKCGGMLYATNKAYNCSNYRDEKIKCDFVIWREISGRQISPSEAVLLATEKKTPVLSGFTTKNGPIDRMLVVNDEFMVKLI